LVTADRSGTARLDGLRLGGALGAAILVHPVIGGLAVVTVALVVALRPGLAAVGIPGIGVAACLGLPQAATTLGFALPAWSGLLTVPLAGVVLVGLTGRPRAAPAVAGLGRAAQILAGLAGLVLADETVPAVLEAGATLLASMPLLAGLAVAGFLIAPRRSASVVVLAAAGVGLVVAAIGQVISGDGVDLAVAGLHFELPKAIQFWLPVFAAIVAAVALDEIERRRGPRLARLAIAGAIVAAIALPLRLEPVDRIHLGEHRISETLATQLGHAGEGYWSGFPDPRRLLDAPRFELVRVLRAEIEAGRLGPDGRSCTSRRASSSGSQRRSACSSARSRRWR